MNIQEHSEFIKLNAYELYTKAWQPETTDKDATLAPIILMHDSLGSVDLWRDFPAQLAAESCRTVIAYDRLGFGKSSANPDPLSTDFVYAEAQRSFRALLQHYSIQQFIVMGHSVGGGMSVVIATEYQEQCHGLITIAAQYEVEELTLSGIREAKTGFAQPGQLERLAKYHGDKAQWVLDAWTETWLSPSFRQWNLEDYVGKVQCPSLIIHGELDEYGTTAQAQKLFSGIKADAELEILEGLHHMPHKEQPALVAALICDFVNDLS